MTVANENTIGRAMRRISWIVTVPLMLVLVVFSVVNRDRVPIDLWPFDLQTVPLPISFLVLGGIFVGFLAGALIMWISASRGRRRAREAKFRSSHLEREVIRLQREVDRAKQQTPPTPAAGPRGGTGEGTSVPAVSSGR